MLILHGANGDYATPVDARNLYHALAHAYQQSGYPDLVGLHFFDDIAHHLTDATQHLEGLSPAAPLNARASTWLTSHLRQTGRLRRC